MNNLHIWLRKNTCNIQPIDKETIGDRNKAYGFARLVTSVQITWFFIQCLVRWQQQFPLSTLEITTFATILATLNSLFFWYHKPLDVETPIIIRMKNRIADVLIDAGESARKPYSRTPLDCLKSPPANTSVVAPFWFGLGVVINFDKESCSRTLKRFGNCKNRPPAELTTLEIIYGVLFEVIYFDVHLVSLNQLFPSKAEFYLWRVSNLFFWVCWLRI